MQKNSNFDIFNSVLYMKSGSIPLSFFFPPEGVKSKIITFHEFEHASEGVKTLSKGVCLVVIVGLCHCCSTSSHGFIT